ncbi:unnamed protein product [Penicillium nalgiovense]|nr:unnamed protein product [Penicillium nalgiovense]
MSIQSDLLFQELEFFLGHTISHFPLRFWIVTSAGAAILKVDVYSSWYEDGMRGWWGEVDEPRKGDLVS